MTTRVTIESGHLLGRRVLGGVSFLGIPYAAPPFGPRRMRPPVPPSRWEGVRDATAYGPTVPKGQYPAPYRRLFPEVTVPGDDCLNLNVWTPDPTAHGMPVLVWIHGGFFTNGSGSVAEYDGTAFARSGIVCVTINYRLAAEGFLYLGDEMANIGLLDQIAALRWVQENIAAFGGDPGRVTVGGQSAGGTSVLALLAAPRAQGLFARAIVQSGVATRVLRPEQGRLVAERLGEALGLAPTRAAFAEVLPDRLAAAASDLAAEVRTAPDRARWGELALAPEPFGPVVDGAVLGLSPLEALRAGYGGDVPLLIGTNRDEASMFFVPTGMLDAIDDTALTATASAFGLTGDQIAVYRNGRPGASLGEVLSAIATDWYFGVSAVRVAEIERSADTWLYRFDHPEPSANYGLGASHGVEIPYIFGTIDRPETRPRVGDRPSRAVAVAAQELWTSFIRGESPGWHPYTDPERTTALITDGIFAAGIFAVDDPAADERRVWRGRW